MDLSARRRRQGRRWCYTLHRQFPYRPAESPGVSQTRDKYLVNWCPRCRTAISDLEVVHEEQQGHLGHIRYPGTGSRERLVVATTRPETMLGDAAVAVNPSEVRKVLTPLRLCAEIIDSRP